MSAGPRPLGASVDQPNAICEVCSATFYTAAATRADRPVGRCDHCGGPLWAILAPTERAIPHPPAGVRDLESYRRRRRR